MIWIYSLVAVVIVSSISLIGVFSLGLKPIFLKKILLPLVGFSAGALIGDSFIHLLPEAIEERGFDNFVSVSILVGILTFFILEKFLRWHHCHDASCQEHAHHLGTLSLASDTLHNAIDGLLIGASFIVSVPLGIVTTVAVILHEIPQELGNFGVLLHSGFSIAKALLYNFLSALSAVAGVIVALLIGARAESFQSFMIPFTAGTFIYIALSDLIPELHKENTTLKSFFQLFFVLLGISFMYLLLLVE